MTDIFVLLQNTFPSMSSQQLVHRLYPYNSILGKEGCSAVEGVLSVSQDVKPRTKYSELSAGCVHAHCGLFILASTHFFVEI